MLEQYAKVDEFADMVSYSSKTNQDVTKILEDATDCMFSVHLENELAHVSDLSRVLFLAQGWTEQQIRYLIDEGIRWFVVDNEVDLDTLLQTLEQGSEQINLLLRLRLKEHSIRTEKYYVFGMTAEQIRTRILALRSHTNISQIGLHFHRKTQNMSEWNLIFELENTFRAEFWESVDIINIGGGLPSVYANTNLHAFEGIFAKIHEFRKWCNAKDMQVMIEPGRFIAAPACRLQTRIMSIHGNTIIVDASVYSGDMDALIVPVKLLVQGELEKGEGKPYVIKGITPCSLDIFRYRVYLPEKSVGDQIIFLNAGAYNFASDFCDLERVPTEVVE